MLQFSSVAQSCPTLWPHESQHARPPCPSPTPSLFQYPIILPFHTVHGVLKARILKWFASPSRASGGLIREDLAPRGSWLQDSSSCEGSGPIWSPADARLAAWHGSPGLVSPGCSPHTTPVLLSHVHLHVVLTFSLKIYIYFYSFLIWLLWVLIVACRLFPSTMRGLVSWPGIKPRPLSLGTQNLSHWTTREVSTCHIFLKTYFLLLIYLFFT